MNKVILVGNLARDPELRQTPNGIPTARFTVAVSRRYQRDGQTQADFISCIAWRQTAEFVSRYFRKGSGIQLCGSIQTRSWDGNDGQRHYATDVVVDEVSFNGGRNQNQSEGGNGTYAQSSAPAYNNVPSAPAPSNDDFGGDFDAMGFADLDGSEDDLPF